MMKKIKFTLFSLFLLALAACKKDQSIIKQPLATVNPATVTDSTSFIIGSKTYTNVPPGLSNEVGNYGVNVKLDSVVAKNHYYYSGDKDSVLFSERYIMIDPAKTGNDDAYMVSFFFVKKFGKNQLTTQSLILAPPDRTVLFQPGFYPYATDFNRENSMNGVAIQIYKKSAVGGMLSTYSPLPLEQPTTVNKSAQLKSVFQVITFKQTDTNQYLLEAKFSATVFDGNETPVNLSNGYVRLTIYP